MIFNLLLIVLLSYLFYKRGMDYLLRARVVEDSKAERMGYIMFLISGTTLGDFLGIWTIYHFAPLELFYQIAAGTLCSIFIGEALFVYSRRLAKRIPTIQERKNY